MSEHHNAISFELGDLARKAAIAAGSFFASAALAVVIKSVLRENLGMTVLLLIALFVSMLFAMLAARTYVKAWLRNYGWLVIPSAIAALLVVSSLKQVAFVLIFLLNALICLFLRPLKNDARVGIELNMLTAVLGSFVFGGKAGALLGFAAMLMEYALTARFSYFSPVTTLTYAVIGFSAVHFSALGITAVGIVATVFYNVITSTIIVAFMGGHIEKCARFGISDIAINAAIFTTAAPWLLSILR